MKTTRFGYRFRLAAAFAAAVPAAYAASWTTTTLSDGQSVESVSAVGAEIAVADAAASATVVATTGEGLFRVNLDGGSSSGFGALSLGTPSDASSPALQAGANVSFIGRSTPRDGWDWSWLDLAVSGEVAVSSGSVRARNVTLPDSVFTLVKTGAGELAVGTVGASSVTVSAGTLTLGQAAPADANAPAADPIVWLAADRIRAEDVVSEGGVDYLACWYDARGAEAPATVDGFTAYAVRCARPVSATTKDFIASRSDGAFPIVVAAGLNGKPVIDFGSPWFTKDGTDWATSGAACMALERYSDGKIVTGDIAKEGFIVVAQNTKYDVPVVWAANTQFIHSGYGSVKNDTEGGWAILDLANSSAKNTFGLWSIDAEPVSPVDSSSFNTSAFKNNSYHLVSFKTTSTGGRAAPVLIASDRYDQNGVGGVRVAEIIYYYRELTDAERTQTQKYLMDKWGLGDHPLSADVSLEAATVDPGATLEYAGSGTLSVASAAVRGTVAARSGTVSLASDIAADAVLHLDASAADTLDTFDDNGTIRVRSWRDVRDNGFVAYAVTNTSEAASNDETSYARNIAPYILTTALPTLHDATVGAKTMPCVDLGDMYKGTTATEGSSATMLFNQTVSFAEGYIVFFDNNTTASGQRMTIWGLYNGGSGNYNPNLLRGAATEFYGTSSTLRSGDHIELIRLDGTDSSVSSSPGRGAFHQYTLGLDAVNTNIRSFGRDTDNRFGGIKVCEAIAFSEKLDDARRLRLEQYLMKKWFGAEHPEAADIEKTTTQALSVAGGASIAVDGDLCIASGGSLTFGVDADGNWGGVTVSGEFSSAGPIAVNVTSEHSERLAIGDHIVVSAASIDVPGLSECTLSLPASGAQQGKLRVIDGNLVVRVSAKGMFMIIR